MFEEKTFSVIEFGSELTLKRAKIIEDIIIKNGGKILPYLQSKFFKII